MITDDLKLLKLEEDYNIKSFNCSDDDLNDFLFVDAKNYYKEMLASTYLIESSSKEMTVAYFSLLNDSIIFDTNSIDKSIWNKLNRKIPNSKRRGHYPALKIGRLAVSSEYKRHGIGKNIIEFVKYLLSFDKRFGCRFITVDAYRNAVPFYGKCGFKLLSSSDKDEPTRAMYYDLKNFEL